MQNKIIFSLLIGSFFIGCGQPKIIDPCELDYQKCSLKCKVDYIHSAIKNKLCIAKCKTFYAACKTKQKTIEGYETIKKKIDE